MAHRWRDLGKALVRRGRQVAPLVISAGLITWLVWNISPERLFEALSASSWPWLVALSVLQMVVLFLWDTVCVWWLFCQPRRDLPFVKVLRVRCDTVIWSAINLEIGQAAFAWQLAELLGVPVTSTLGYCVLLALVDVGTLLSLALAGFYIYPSSLTAPWRWICVGGLGALAILVVLLKLLPQRWRRWLANKPWASWLTWVDARAVIKLWLLRLTMFLLVLTYAGLSLAVCRVPVDAASVVGIIPFVIMAESLPGTAGLGERETALVYLYPAPAEQRAVLLSFGLIWSTVIITGRILISLVSWCLPRSQRPSQDRRCAA